jgi:hypothetical protein
MARAKMIHLIMADNTGAIWTDIETSETKAKALVKQYQTLTKDLGTPALRATFKPVAA